MADAATVAQTRAIYQQYKPWIDRYRGGLPAGFVAAIIQHESGGRPDATGDASLGEYGLMQITSAFPPTVGLSSDARYDPETNIFLGCLGMQLDSVNQKLWAPRLIELGTADAIKLARLAFAVGAAGTRTLITAATNLSPIYSGNVYNTLKTYAARTGAVNLGSQSAATVAARIAGVDDLWSTGAAVAPLFYGPPEKIPAPSGMAYSIPTAAVPYLVNPLVPLLVAFSVIAGTVYLAARG